MMGSVFLQEQTPESFLCLSQSSLLPPAQPLPPPWTPPKLGNSEKSAIFKQEKLHQTFHFGPMVSASKL